MKLDSFRWWLALLLSMWFSCGSAASGDYQVQLAGVPLVAQTYNACGPASLVMVMNYLGVPVALRQVSAGTRINDKAYMSASVIDRYVAPFGLGAIRVKKANVNTLRNVLANGYPVIVLQWLQKIGETPHFRVITGFDDGTRQLTVNDPLLGRGLMHFDDFESLWGVYDQEAIVIFPLPERQRVYSVVFLH